MARKPSSSRGAASKTPASKTPARKTWLAKGEYYPKVDLSDLEDRLMSSWSPSSVAAPAEAATAAAPMMVAAPVVVAVLPHEVLAHEVLAREQEYVMPPPVAISQPPRPAPQPTPIAAPRSAKGPLRLPTSLDLAAARPLANSLLERRGQPMLIDAAAVIQVGAQCAQVLLSAKRTWDADGVALSIVNCAPRMIEDFALIGIDCTRLATGDLHP